MEGMGGGMGGDGGGNDPSLEWGLRKGEEG